MIDKIHIGKLIQERMRVEGRSVSWLAKRMYCDRSNIYKIFQKQSIDTDLLLHISKEMEFDFFIYYYDYHETMK
jgi:hypothetical protein